MEYLGIERSRPRVAVFDFTGCEGCSLQLANREENLAAFLSAIEIADFRLISSAHSDDYQVALIDGAITREDEIERLQRIRSRAAVLVALGSCACFGGVNRQKNAYDLEAANREVYGDCPKPTIATRAVGEVVEVDMQIPGCPVSKPEVERIVQHLVLGVPYQLPVYPVCVECKRQFNSCLFDLGQLCLGPVTRAGCDAACPSGGLGCWGCRGPAVDANLDEFLRLSRERGFARDEIEERLGFFGGFAEEVCR